MILTIYMFKRGMVHSKLINLLLAKSSRENCYCFDKIW